MWVVNRRLNELGRVNIQPILSTLDAALRVNIPNAALLLVSIEKTSKCFSMLIVKLICAITVFIPTKESIA